MPNSNNLVYTNIINQNQGKSIIFPYGIVATSRQKFNNKLGVSFVFGALYKATSLSMTAMTQDIFTPLSVQGFRAPFENSNYFGVNTPDDHIIDTNIELGFKLVRKIITENGDLATSAEMNDDSISKYKVISGIELTKIILDTYDFSPILSESKYSFIQINNFNPNLSSSGIDQFITFNKVLIRQSDNTNYIDFGLSKGGKWHLNYVELKGGLFGGNTKSGISYPLYLAGLFKIKGNNELSATIVPHWGIFVQRLIP